MSLIKCSECKKEISDKASACPHCGCPLEQQKKETNLIKIESLKEITTKKTVIIHFLLSFILFLLICLPLKYGSNYQKSYSILSLFQKGLADDLIKLLPFGLIIFINFFISILTRKNSKASKIIYIISLIFLVFINYEVTKEGIQLHYVYPLMYLTTASLIFVKKETKLKKEEIEILKEKKKLIEEENKKLEESYKKEDKKLPKIIVLIFVILLGIISSLIFMNENNKANIPLDEIININQVTSGNIMYAKITNDFINLRSEPDTDSDKIGKVIKNEEYEVVEVKVGNVYKWYKIKDKNNKEGYIANPKYQDKYIELFEITKTENDIKEKFTFHDTVDTNDKIYENDKGIEINPEEDKQIINSSSSSSNNNKNNNNSQNKKPSNNNNTSSNTNNSNSSSNTTTKPETNNTTSNNQEKEENNNTTTENNKKQEECNNQILERTAKYEKDVEELDNRYKKLESSTKSELNTVDALLDDYGGYISQSSYNSRRSSLQSQLSSAQTAYQRAALDTSGASAGLMLKYQQQIEEIREEMSYLAARYELSQDYDALADDYNDLLNEHKEELQRLYDEFCNDIDKIEASC